MEQEDYIIEMRHITKRFGAVVANDDVSISVRKGEIYALLGENGATMTFTVSCDKSDLPERVHQYII